MSRVQEFRRVVRVVAYAASALLVAAAVPTGAQADPDMRSFRSLIGPRAAGLAALYADHASTVADYVAALTRFRAGVEQGLFTEAAPLTRSETPPPFVPYLWTTEDASTIRKLPDGTFLVAHSRLLGNLHSETICHGADWPNFYCGDDQARTMAVPDLSTVIFDGVEYSRAMPQIEVEPMDVPVASETAGNR